MLGTEISSSEEFWHNSLGENMHFNWQTPESLKSVTTKLQFIKIWKDFRKNLVVGLYKFILIILEEGKWDLL